MKKETDMPDDPNPGGAAHAKLEVEEKYILGRSQIFTPEVINDIHVKSELGRYRIAGFRCSRKSRIGTT